MRYMTPLIILVLALPAFARTVVPPPTLPCLANVFVGGQPGVELEYFRLELKPDGTGLLTAQYLPQNPAVAYKITKTTLSGYKIEFAVTPIDRPAESIYVRGRALCFRLDLVVGGAAKLVWNRDVVLEPLERVMSRINAVNARAAEVKATLP